MTQALADMRRDYTRDGLAEAQAPAGLSRCFTNGLRMRSKPSNRLSKPMP